MTTAGQPADVSWRRNQAAVTAAAFVGYTGFTLVMPFLPLYIQQLGVADAGDAALWAGLSLGITPAITALVSPFWGKMADRFGRKLLIERSLVAFVIVMALMAYASEAWHIFALRAALGFFAGYGALTVAMAAENAPAERIAPAIGMVQTAQRLGPAIGPVIGGSVAAVVGIRNAFFVTAACYAVALLVVVFGYSERRGETAPSGGEGRRQASFSDVLKFPNFAILVTAVFVLQFVERSLGPILPLLVADLGAPRDQVALVSGIIFSVVAGAAAGGAQMAGFLLRRTPARQVILAATWAAIAVVTVAAATGHVAILGAALGVGGLVVGAAMTSAYAAVGSITPPGMHATTFGLLTSGALVGLAIGPTISGLVASFGIRLVFGMDAVVLLVLILAIRRRFAREAGS